MGEIYLLDLRGTIQTLLEIRRSNFCKTYVSFSTRAAGLLCTSLQVLKVTLDCEGALPTNFAFSVSEVGTSLCSRSSTIKPSQKAWQIPQPSSTPFAQI